MTDQALLHSIDVVDYNATYGLPVTAMVLAAKNSSGSLWIIHYPASPVGDADFDLVPNGSVVIDNVNFKWYVKTGTFGDIDGVWKASAAMS